MAYPLPPDFAGVGPDAFNPPAWWRYALPDGRASVCATSGAAVVRAAAAALGLPQTQSWSDAFAAALASRARSLAASYPDQDWSPLVSALQASASARAVSPTAMAFAIWLGYYAAGGLRLDAVQLAPGAAMPPWGVPLPEGPSAGVGLVCFDPSREAFPLSDAGLSQAQAESASGVRVHPGESPPAPSSPTPPAGGPPGVSTIVLVAAALGVVGGVAWFLASTPKGDATGAARRPPARRR